ncbi:MAG: hypothetical protein QM737_02675 [Ferruginibacter sp.]
MESLQPVPFDKIELKEYYFVSVMNFTERAVMFCSGSMLIEFIQVAFNYPYWLEMSKMGNWESKVIIFLEQAELLNGYGEYPYIYIFKSNL